MVYSEGYASSGCLSCLIADQGKMPTHRRTRKRTQRKTHRNTHRNRKGGFFVRRVPNSAQTIYQSDPFSSPIMTDIETARHNLEQQK
jgi:hypothetical protein